MSEGLERIYERYSDVRPNVRAPQDEAELLGGRETIYRKVFAPWLPESKQARILDIGSGYGEFLYFLQKQGYGRAEGIDLDRQHVEVATRLGVRNLRWGDAQAALAEVAEEYDCISAVDVLEHIPRDQVLTFLALIRRALKPGGRLIVQVPNAAAFYTPLFFMDFSHETPFTAPSLKQALELASFSEIEVRPRGPVVHGARSAVRAVLWKLISSGLRLIQTIEGGPRGPLDSIYTAAILAVARRP